MYARKSVFIYVSLHVTRTMSLDKKVPERIVTQEDCPWPTTIQFVSDGNVLVLDLSTGLLHIQGHCAKVVLRFVGEGSLVVRDEQSQSLLLVFDLAGRVCYDVLNNTYTNFSGI